MLEVLPIQDKSMQEKLATDCGRNYIDSCMAYHATYDGKLCGICQFTMNEGGGYIKSLASIPCDVCGLSEEQIREALFVLGRATLNFIDLCHVHRAFFSDDEFTDESMIAQIGFKKNDGGVYEMDLTDFFKEPCSHH